MRSGISELVYFCIFMYIKVLILIYILYMNANIFVSCIIILKAIYKTIFPNT